jgi:hypothetical protein
VSCFDRSLALRHRTHPNANTMSDPDRGNPIQVAVVVLLMVGGGWYFLRNYEIAGLDEVSVYPKGSTSPEEQSYVSYQGTASAGTDPERQLIPVADPADAANPFNVARQGGTVTPAVPPTNARALGNLRIASWALDGFGPTKLANATAARNLARVVRKFDIVAIQQVASIERDLIPRLVDIINEGQNRYDYVMGQPVGPHERPEQMAFIFDKTTVLVDRRHTYTLDDPEEQLSFDPLVAWFRAASPPVGQAWTFSLVNVRIDLARAPDEVAVLPHVLSTIRRDGRGEDDVILLGLFQADDAYLLPTVGDQKFKAAVRSRPTDVFGRYQTSNLLIDATATSEYLGRGGAYDFAQVLSLNLAQAETVTSQLPVYAEFSTVEGGL